MRSLATTCDQFGDVETIVFNAGVSFREERSSRQEYDGAIRLAARILARVDSQPGADVTAALDSLRASLSDVAAGALGVAFDPDRED